MGLYKFRRELLEELVKRNYEVYVSVPDGEYVQRITDIGCNVILTEFNRRGMNPVAEQKLYITYCDIIKKVKPDKVLTYTVKPNIYGGLAAKKYSVPQIANITGLGTALEQQGSTQRVLLRLYRRAFEQTQTVFFQNKADYNFFEQNRIKIRNTVIIPGSGVNLDRFQVLEYPSDETTRFLFISRIMKEKGIDYYLSAAETIHKKHPNTEFHICGFCEDDYQEKIKIADELGNVVYHGLIDNVDQFLKNIHCVVHPTYYPEGMSNVLLEGCACGRPIITTDHPGCREIVDDGMNGFMIRQQNQDDLNQAIEKFLNLSYQQKKQMGIFGREKVEKEFDRKIVVNKYLEEIEKEV